jgi:AraC-like DNA-binding protein
MAKFDEDGVQRIVTDRGSQLTIRSALGADAALTVGGSLVEALRALELTGAPVLVLSSTDGARDELALRALCREVHRRAPRLVVIVLAGAIPNGSSILELTGGGVILGLDCEAPSGLARLRQAVTAARREVRLQSVADAMTEGVHHDVEFLVQYAVTAAFRPLSAGMLATGAPLARSTMLNRVQRRLGMTLQQLVNWGRVMAGMTVLESTLRTVESVANTFGYEDASGFTKLCRGIAGHAPTAVRDAGGTSELLRLWRAAILRDRRA